MVPLIDFCHCGTYSPQSLTIWSSVTLLPSNLYAMSVQVRNECVSGLGVADLLYVAEVTKSSGCHPPLA